MGGVSPPPIKRQPQNASYRAQNAHAQASESERAVQAKQCGQCIPSEACRNAVFDWAEHNGRGFPASALGLKRLSVELDELLRCRSMSEEALIIDVGAGIHNLGEEWIFNVRSLHDDDSDALWLLGSFGPWARIHTKSLAWGAPSGFSRFQASATRVNSVFALSKNGRLRM